MGFNLFDEILGGPLGAIGIDGSQMPIIGGMFTNPATEKAERDMRRAAAQYEAYRPELRQANVSTANQALAQYLPAQRALIDMYGPSAYQPLTFTDPFGAPPANILTRGEVASVEPERLPPVDPSDPNSVLGPLGLKL